MEIVNLGNRFVNNFIYSTSSGYVMIDTGYPNGYPAFCKQLRRHNIALQDVSYIFLTHAHDDHAGFLNELLHHTQAKAIVSAKAMAGLKHGQNSFQGGCSTRLAWLFCKVMTLLGKGSHRFPPLEGGVWERCIPVNEETRPALERELSASIVETPGHTGCSLSLFLNNGLLFCGDAAMNGFPSSHRVTIWMENNGDFFSSWQKIIALRPRKLYPGHGAPFPVSDLERFLPKGKAQKSYPLTYRK